MRYELKKIEIWSVIKIVFILSLILGFFVSLFSSSLIALMRTLVEASGGEELIDVIPFAGLGWFFLVIFGTLGFAFLFTLETVFAILLYNIVAGITGGFVFHLDPQKSGGQVVVSSEDGI
jgi:hypothetical protein